MLRPSQSAAGHPATVEQGDELRAGQPHDPVVDRRPLEFAAVQPFPDQYQTCAVIDQQLHPVGALRERNTKTVPLNGSCRRIKRGIIKALPKGLRDWAGAVERALSQVRAWVEHPFHVVKNLFRHRKLRYRGLAKNTAQLHTLFALANLVIVKRSVK